MFYIVEAIVARKENNSNKKELFSALVVVEAEQKPTLSEVKRKISKNDYVLLARPGWMDKDFQIVQIMERIEAINHCPFMGIKTDKNLITCGQIFSDPPKCTEKIGHIFEKCGLKSGIPASEECLSLLEKSSDLIPPWFLNTKKRD